MSKLPLMRPTYVLNLKMRNLKLSILVHTSNSSIMRQWQVDLSDFEASLVYTVNSRQPELFSEALSGEGEGGC